MPLRAYIDGEEVVSLNLTEEEWYVLKKRIRAKTTAVKLPCCGQEGHLRKSSRGLKHFVHPKSAFTCNWKPESPDHLKAKTEILEGCEDAGWPARPEIAEANWQADVLAQKGDKRIAFEVQLSKQTLEETESRQERYRNSGVRGCWFFKRMPNGLPPSKHLPAFEIFKEKDQAYIFYSVIGNRKMSVKYLTESLLKGKFKYCENLSITPPQKIIIAFFEIACWKCKKNQHLYAVSQGDEVEASCGESIALGSIETLFNTELDKHPEVYKAVKSICQSAEGKHLKVGQLKQRYSKTVKESYLSHGCYYCDALFGDFFLLHEKDDGLNSQSSTWFTKKVNLRSFKVEQPHWCYSETREFCE